MIEINHEPNGEVDILTLYLDGTEVGSATIEYVGEDTIYLDSIFIEEDHTGKGYASFLIDYIKTLSCEYITLRVSPFSHCALSYRELVTFYRKRGFKKVEGNFRQWNRDTEK